jgi:hypothetical protein
MPARCIEAKRNASVSGTSSNWTRYLLEECQHVTALDLPADDYVARRIDAVDLKNRLRDIQTDCRDRLHR